MRAFLAALLVMFGLVSFSAAPLSANGENLPNDPKLFDPNEDRILAAGLLPGQTREWKERVFLNDDGNTTALCVEDLTLQQIFPEAGPAVGGGAFCFGEIMIVGANEYAATVFHSEYFPVSDGAIKIPAKKIVNCTLLVKEGTLIPGVATLTEPPRLHVVTCPSDDGTSPLIGSFFTTIISPGTPTSLAAIKIPAKKVFKFRVNP